jgi:inorganic triphosphatase YgiF
MKTTGSKITTKMTMTTREVELKLSISSEGYERLTELMPAKGKTRHQLNIFFDDAKGTLREAKWGFRLRRDDGIWFLTAKGPNKKNDGISDREEIECELSEEKAQELLTGQVTLSDFSEAPATHLLASFGDLNLQEWMRFENLRSVLLWHNIELELDHSSCGAHHRYELEVELPMDELLSIRERLEHWLKKNSIFITPSKEGKLSWAVECSSDS